MKDWVLRASEDLDMSILAVEVMPDHIHLLADAKPQLRLSDAVKVLKGASARWMFLEHPEIKKSLRGGHLWNPSYFVATVSDRSREQVELLESVEFDHSKSGGISPNWSINNSQMAVKRASQK